MVDISRPVPIQGTQLVDVKTGIINTDWLNFLMTLWARTGGAPGVDTTTVQNIADTALATAEVADTNATDALASAALRLLKSANLSDVASVNTARANLLIGSMTAGWVDPTGAGSRATFNMDLALPVGAAFNQAEMTAIANQVIVLQKRIGQLILDEITAKTISH